MQDSTSRHRTRSEVLWVVITTCFVMVTTAAVQGQGTKSSAGQSAEQRADTLLKQMTLEEKIGQLDKAAGVPLVQLPNAPPAEELVRKGLAGSVLWVTEPADINRFQKIAVEESRLHIPLLIGLDVIHGYHTIFPPPLAMSAAWDPKLVERVLTIAAREARAV